MVASWVVDTVEVGEAAGIKPPSWWRERKRLGEAGASQWGEGSPPPPGTNQGCCLLREASSQEMGPSGMGVGAAGRRPGPLLSLQTLEGGTLMDPKLVSVSLRGSV